jgi:CheY-like chemotaxis protein
MSKNRILIIDDDPDVILFLSTVLQDNGYQTMEARDGKVGLEMALKGTPDLILLDLMMPLKSGIALLSDLKTNEDLRGIPVIMVTGVSSETGIDLESFFKRKSTRENDTPRPEGYLEKPVNPVKLLSLVQEVLK